MIGDDFTIVAAAILINFEYMNISVSTTTAITTKIPATCQEKRVLFYQYRLWFDLIQRSGFDMEPGGHAAFEAAALQLKLRQLEVHS